MKEATHLIGPWKVASLWLGGLAAASPGLSFSRVSGARPAGSGSCPRGGAELGLGPGFPETTDSEREWIRAWRTQERGGAVCFSILISTQFKKNLVNSHRLPMAALIFLLILWISGPETLVCIRIRELLNTQVPDTTPVSGSAGLGWGPGICISHLIPGDATALA